MKVSYIIPHRNRHAVLRTHLKQLRNQTYNNFEVIIVDDNSWYEDDPSLLYSDLDLNVVFHRLEEQAGANNARNIGAKIATGEIVLIVGDDNIPHHHLIATHVHEHVIANENIVVQGITPFHPDVMDTRFMHFLDESGMQANWNALKNENGEWKRDATGFCLTTNISMKKELFWAVGGLDASFVIAAWDDVEFGTRLKKYGVQTVFSPSAINLHVHKYNLSGFVNRQINEGMNRIKLCMTHPEISANLLVPSMIRQANDNPLAESVAIAHESLKSMELNKDVLTNALVHASYTGVNRDIDQRSRPFQAIRHMHSPESVFAILNGCRAMEDGNVSYALHCAGWLKDTAQNNWATYAYAGDVYQFSNDKNAAIMMYQKSLELSPNDWAKNGIDEVLNK